MTQLTIVAAVETRRRPWVHNGRCWTRPTSVRLEQRTEQIETTLSPQFNPTGKREWIPGRRWWELDIVSESPDVTATYYWQSHGPITIRERATVQVLSGEWVQTGSSTRWLR